MVHKELHNCVKRTDFVFPDENFRPTTGGGVAPAAVPAPTPELAEA